MEMVVLVSAKNLFFWNDNDYYQIKYLSIRTDGFVHALKSLDSSGQGSSNIFLFMKKLFTYDSGFGSICLQVIPPTELCRSV